MIQGKVTWFNAENGFGFINTDNKEDGDIFVHYSQIVSSGFKVLKEGESVEFELEHNERGPQAHNVSSMRGKSEDSK